MANIDFVEKDMIISLVEEYKGSGYVCDFSNREFQELVYEIMGIYVYSKYPNLSKGRIFRAIMQEYDNVNVGKLILAILRYMQAKQMVSSQNQEKFNQCANLGNRLIGRISKVKTTTPQPAKPVESTIDYEYWLKQLTNLTASEDTPQSRGYAFEKLLKNLFEVFSLNPRGSFKIVGEQIDGSFEFRNEVYLLEAKWTNKKTDKSQLVVFNQKVQTKSSFSRGVFISYAGYEGNAVNTLSDGTKVGIVLITVQELAIALGRKEDISKLLWTKIRALAEEGNCNKNYF